MSTSRNHAPRKPSGGRPLPKRLFSFDALRKQTSNHDTNGSSLNSESTLRLVEEPSTIDSETYVATNSSWFEKESTSSPTEETHPMSRKTPPLSKERFRARRQASKPAPVDAELANAGDPKAEGSGSKFPLSPSRYRWNTVRQHVLPSQDPDEEPVPPTPSDTASIASSIIPSRPDTPKSHKSGAGKKGMKQVVEEARYAQVSRNVLEEIRNACWSIRFGHVTHSLARVERDPSQSSHYTSKSIPFGASLAFGASAVNLSSVAKGGLRQRASIQSFASTTTPMSQLTLLLTRLEQRNAALSIENEVLAALLVPYLSPERFPQPEAEQALAIETFEFLTKGRQAASNKVGTLG